MIGKSLITIEVPDEKPRLIDADPAVPRGRFSPDPMEREVHVVRGRVGARHEEERPFMISTGKSNAGGISGGRKRGWMVAAALAVLSLSGCETAQMNPESSKLARTLPIADLHLHPDPGISPSEIKDRMDRSGVRWAGSGAKRGGRAAWVDYARALGGRLIAFGGQAELNRVYRTGGVSALEDAENPAFRDLLRRTEEDLRAGRIKGIGEIFVNNRRSNPNPGFRRKIRADAPAIRRLYALVSGYGAFITIHMEPDADSAAQLERLLASDRRGRVLWNHCGSNSAASDVRPLLARNPNLFCELSFRYPPVLRNRLVERFPVRLIFGSAGPAAAWRRLIEDFPDRFMIGTDAHSREEYEGAIRMVRAGLLPYLRPETARGVAYRNAQRLFGLR